MLSKGGPGTETPITDELVKRMGFINRQAFDNYKHLKEQVGLDGFLIRLVNLEQMLIETKRHVEELDSRLVSTGTERIGSA